jgi:hypothetical protein
VEALRHSEKSGTRIFLMKFHPLPLLLLLGSTALPAESFEGAPAGPFNRLESSIGSWSGDEGNLRIHAGRGKTGKQSLRISGEGERTAILQLATPAEKGSLLAM